MSNGELILDIQIKDMAWDLPEMQSSAESRSAFRQVNTLGEPFWTLNVRTTYLTQEQFRKWTAWLTRRRGERFSFTAWRKSRPAPFAGGVASDASLTVESIDAEAGTVTFGNAGAYKASPGDMVGYYTAANGYWIGEVLADAAASAGEVTLSVHPAPLTPHASTPSPRRLQALGEFKMIGRPEIMEVYDDRWVAFQARQVVRPVTS
ncbi:hypothetical protein [Euryhalocaulis caribicus]|uniref:hypothetical protein n=1 Tax=Euryhalocaulis caribicus TaxID=1161401 RepID=UPI0003A5D9BA|nr:hypothetical protein [Euryhalocaulis caribicus]